MRDDDIVLVPAVGVVVHRTKHALPERRSSIIDVRTRLSVHEPEPETAVSLPGLLARITQGGQKRGQGKGRGWGRGEARYLFWIVLLIYARGAVLRYGI